MIEILLIAILVAVLILLYFQFQNKSSNTDMKFQASLDEKIKLIHDEMGRNREENSKNSLDNRQELSKNLNQFLERGHKICYIFDTI